MLVSLHDSASGNSITNGFFTADRGITWSNQGGGNYNVSVPANTWFGADGPAYKVQYINSGNGDPRDVALVKDTWPP